MLCGFNPERACAQECVGCCQSVLECDWLHADPRFAADSRLLMSELRALLRCVRAVAGQATMSFV